MSGSVETVSSILCYFYLLFAKIEFLGYTALMCYVFFLTLGTIGFAASLKECGFESQSIYVLVVEQISLDPIQSSFVIFMLI